MICDFVEKAWYDDFVMDIMFGFLANRIQHLIRITYNTSSIPIYKSI